MKAERRHELQENSLIRSVRNFPEFWRDYGSKILLGLILVLLAILLIRMWINKKEDSRRQMSEDLTAARASLEELRSTNEVAPPQRPGMPPDPEAMQNMKPEQVADHRKRVWSRVESAANNVLQNSSDAAQLAEAKLLRADLNYHFGLLAELGVGNGANKERGIDSPPKEYFDRAAQNYQEVIAQAANVRPPQVAAARLGLAAVYENRRQFGEARALYETVQREGPDEISRLQAAARLRALVMAKPDQFVATETLQFPTEKEPTPKEPTSNPNSQPTSQSSAATQSTTGASTMSSTRSATMPATMPSTAP